MTTTSSTTPARQLGAQRTRPTSASSTTSSHRSSTALSPALFPTSLTSLPDDSNQPLSLSPVSPKRSSYGHPPKTESPTSLIPFTSRFFGAHGSTRDVREGVRVLHESLGSHLKELDLVAAVLVRRITSEESAAKACEESVAALVPSLMYSIKN
ncbi:hypothetical protein BCR33DRAFT_505856 [Rhizoclosmatium globosum]|uniref:Uncharacterized protein n=1 Tax=Rhizoclosmatium globosum TaxID=329046 RepID=A0A1Y2BKV4_9FUNG|nr:hypothetical protein BCR33DRAFT_505856 [Rhizoclosmatium globosum]|eukprot:ORY35247.1 hypothetical protein BCR33DRAFT_505856 [Rhizoclosmatium globosum]